MSTSASRVAARFLESKIRTPPRSLAMLFKRFETELGEVVGRLEASLAKVESYDHESIENYMMDLEWPTRISDARALRSYVMNEVVRKLPDRFAYSLQGFKQDPVENWANMLASEISYAVENLNRQPIHSLLGEAANALNNANPNTRSYYDLPEQVDVDLKGVVDAWNGVQAFLEGTAKKINTYMRAGPSTAPEPERDGRYETLYHASTRARSLYQKGFDRVVPESGGLGGSQTDKSGKNGISFTYDLHAALQISRMWKELAMIAHGQIKAREIISWIPKGRVERVFDYLRQLNGIGRFSPRIDVVNGVPRAYDVERAREPVPIDLEEIFKDPADKVKLYMAYLKNSGNRMDPFVVRGAKAIVADLLTVDPKGIGVVAATVDMEHPSILFLPGEKEYRVQPDGVISVDRFIS